jgi:hypothetical protein
MNSLPNEDRVCLVQSLLKMNLMHSDNYTIFKLLKDVAYIIAKEAMELIPLIFNMLEQG